MNILSTSDVSKVCLLQFFKKVFDNEKGFFLDLSSGVQAVRGAHHEAPEGSGGVKVRELPLGPGIP